MNATDQPASIREKHLSLSESTMMPTVFTQTLESKLGQLQAQLQHMPSTSDADYQSSLNFTRRFVGEVLQDLELFIVETAGLTQGYGSCYEM
jgi:hypothetical protein